ncbi:hypothetical protein B0H14DRAFT_3528625 [Mycena olivaceomarginata]|nr:hypothetical protein B0H14DRAFT_3528625 [Mycena olivaceomarginata]
MPIPPPTSNTAPPTPHLPLPVPPCPPPILTLPLTRRLLPPLRTPKPRLRAPVSPASTPSIPCAATPALSCLRSVPPPLRLPLRAPSPPPDDPRRHLARQNATFPIRPHPRPSRDDTPLLRYAIDRLHRTPARPACIPSFADLGKPHANAQGLRIRAFLIALLERCRRRRPPQSDFEVLPTAHLVAIPRPPPCRFPPLRINAAVARHRVIVARGFPCQLPPILPPPEHALPQPACPSRLLASNTDFHGRPFAIPSSRDAATKPGHPPLSYPSLRIPVLAFNDRVLDMLLTYVYGYRPRTFPAVPPIRHSLGLHDRNVDVPRTPAGPPAGLTRNGAILLLRQATPLTPFAAAPRAQSPPIASVLLPPATHQRSFASVTLSILISLASTAPSSMAPAALPQCSRTSPSSRASPVWLLLLLMYSQAVRQPPDRSELQHEFDEWEVIIYTMALAFLCEDIDRVSTR